MAKMKMHKTGGKCSQITHSNTKSIKSSYQVVSLQWNHILHECSVEIEYGRKLFKLPLSPQDPVVVEGKV